MTPNEIKVLNQACRMSGTDPTTISPENPFSKSGKRAQMLQVACQEIDPVQCARWRKELGMKASVGTLAECASGAPLSEAARQDLWHHDENFIVEWRSEQARRHQAKEQQQQEELAAIRLRNALVQTRGDEAAARRKIEAEDALNAQHEQRRLGAWQ